MFTWVTQYTANDYTLQHLTRQNKALPGLHLPACSHENGSVLNLASCKWVTPCLPGWPVPWWWLSWSAGTAAQAPCHLAVATFGSFPTTSAATSRPASGAAESTTTGGKASSVQPSKPRQTPPRHGSPYSTSAQGCLSWPSGELGASSSRTHFSKHCTRGTVRPPGNRNISNARLGSQNKSPTSKYNYLY